MTFHLVCVGWLLFRAESLDPGRRRCWRRSRRASRCPRRRRFLPVAVCVLPLLIYQFVQYRTRDLDVIFRSPWYVRSAFYTLCFYAFVLAGEYGGKQFIYFQF